MNSVLAKEPFTIDNTPDCPKAVIKGAQNSLDKFALSLPVIEYPRGVFGQEGIRARARYKYYLRMKALKIADKGSELMEYAKKKYKCDLELQFPPIPENEDI